MAFGFPDRPLSQNPTGWNETKYDYFGVCDSLSEGGKSMYEIFKELQPSVIFLSVRLFKIYAYEAVPTKLVRAARVTCPCEQMLSNSAIGPIIAVDPGTSMTDHVLLFLHYGTILMY